MLFFFLSYLHHLVLHSFPTRRSSDLSGENLNVLLAVDTSGSIDQRAVNVFLSEVRGILRAYPHLRCDLYYADAEVYGPQDRKSTRLNSSHLVISYAVFCLKKKKVNNS